MSSIIIVVLFVALSFVLVTTLVIVSLRVSIAQILFWVLSQNNFRSYTSKDHFEVSLLKHINTLPDHAFELGTDSVVSP